MALNKAIIIGYLGDEPQVRTLNSGGKVASLSVSTPEKGYTTKSGQQIPDKSEWHNIVLWDRLADVAEKYLHKGSMVYVEGKIRTRSYDKNGEKRYVTEIHADNLQLLDRKSETSNQQQQYRQQTQAQQPAYAPVQDDEQHDETPF